MAAVTTMQLCYSNARSWRVAPWRITLPDNRLGVAPFWEIESAGHPMAT